MADLAKEKAVIRKKLLGELEALPTQERGKLSEEVFYQTTSFFQSKKYTHVGLFISFSAEVQTAQLFPWLWRRECKTFVPMYNSVETACFKEYSFASTLIRNKAKFQEPAEDRIFPIVSLDVIFCPLLGFDKKGARLGRGGGFYDRVLQEKARHTPVIGLSFGLQQVNELPTETHDQPLTAVITEQGIQYFTRL